MTRPCLLMIRPAQAARSFVSALQQAVGQPVEVCYSPVVKIEPVDAKIDLTGITHLVFTSANGVAQFARQNSNRACVALCVGETTRQAAASAGMQAIATGRTVADLVDWLDQRKTAFDFDLLYLRGAKVSHDLLGDLSQRGLRGQEVVIYRQCGCNLGQEAVQIIKTRPVLIPVFSANSARNLLKTYNFTKCDTCTPICISPKVAQVFQQAGITQTMLAPTADRAGMIRAIGEML